MAADTAIKAIDKASIHRITSGQVVIDLQTAVKELLENSLDAGATNIEVRFKNHGLKSIEVVDNGSGIAEKDFEGIALKHHTSKLAAFEDLTTVRTFGFRGEALSSLCALCDGFTITTATQGPLGEMIEMDRNGRIKKRSKVARQRGTTVQLSNIFTPLPVRRKEFERNAKREFGKALHLLNAYALGPCASSDGKPVKLTVSNQMDKGAKSIQIRTPGQSSCRASVTALWGPRALDNVVDLDLSFDVERDRMSMRRLNPNGTLTDLPPIHVTVKGLVSKFTVGGGRTGTDRQFFFVNGRPCDLSKVQKAFNEVYKSFNATQSAFLVADFQIPTESCDINVSPDKRTIFLHNEANLIAAFKAALETAFAPSRSMFDVSASQMTQTNLPVAFTQAKRTDSSSSSTQATESGSQARTPAVRTRDTSPDPEPSSSRQSSPSRAPSPDSDDVGPEMPTPVDGTEALEEEKDEPLPGDAIPTKPESLTPSSPPRGGDKLTFGNEEVPPTQEEEQEQADDASNAGVEPTSPARPPVVARTTQRSSSPIENMDVEVSVIGASWSQTSVTAVRASSPMQATPRHASVDDSGNEPPRKRLRTNSEEGDLLPENDDDEEMDSDNLDDFKKAKDIRSVEGLWFSSQSRTRASAAKVSSQPSSPARSKNSPVKSAGSPVKSAKASHKNMRTQLAGFAMAGSQKPAAAETDKDEDEMDEEDRMVEDDENRMDVDGEDDEDSDEAMNNADYQEDDDANADDNGREGTSAIEAPKKRVRRRRSPSVDGVEEDAAQTTSASVDVRVKAEEGAGSLLSADEVIDLTSDDEPGPVLSKVTQRTSSTKSSRISSKDPKDERVVLDGPEVLRQDSNTLGDVTIELALDRVKTAYERLRQALSAPRPAAESSYSADDGFSADAGLANTDDAESAANALARVIDKADFAKMDIVGQFNRGFIIARRRKQPESGGPSMDDLFIVDQHASDEKYNFETLQQTTKIESQRLLRPRPLELTAADEMIARDHLDVLRQNGFEIEDSGTGNDSDGARLRLVAQPVSKSTTFDMRDLEELIHLLQDAPGGVAVRCSKARAMFASRACRKSVMIGMPLTKGQMTAVVQHMGTMDQPWNCPHGRPTMRHLIDLADLNGRAKGPRPIDWASLSLSC
ncbi:DNA mismatch repair protein MutL [Schizophyllum commune Tattone D]|nr:DNA mismatch repair protein MutL [Schizophyllum commune Tattone D]